MNKKLPERTGDGPWLGVVLSTGVVLESVDCVGDVVAVVGIAVISVVVAVNGCWIIGSAEVVVEDFDCVVVVVVGGLVDGVVVVVVVVVVTSSVVGVIVAANK